MSEPEIPEPIRRMSEAMESGQRFMFGHRPSMDGEPVVRVSVAAERLGISTRELYELLGAGTIPSVRVGEDRLLRISSLHSRRFIDLAAEGHR